MFGVLARPASKLPPPSVTCDRVEAMHGAMAAREDELAEAEALLANLVANDMRLCNSITDNQRLAESSEPQACDFAKLDDWHSALRKWQDDRAILNETSVLEAERTRVLGQIVAVKHRIGGLKFDLVLLQLDEAKEEHAVAQQHADAMAARVRDLQIALRFVRQ